jgi:hypothetical protein
MQVRLSARAASIAPAALALAAPWSLELLWSAVLSSLRHDGRLLFTAGCTDSWTHQICRVAND